MEKKIKMLVGEVKNILKIEDLLFDDKSCTINSSENNPLQQKPPPSYKGKILEKLDSIIEDFIFCSKGSDFHFSASNSLDVFVNQYSVNYRCFFDKLKLDENYIIFLYSRKKNEIIFVNNMFMYWIGWNPKFIAEKSSDLIIQGKSAWFDNLHAVNKKTEGFLTIKTKNQGEISFYSQIQNISKEHLSSYSIGILLPLNNKN